MGKMRWGEEEVGKMMVGDEEVWWWRKRWVK